MKEMDFINFVYDCEMFRIYILNENKNKNKYDVLVVDCEGLPLFQETFTCKKDELKNKAIAKIEELTYTIYPMF